ncbi:hypothetical protein FKM82_002845 [Ascaphus truei]
MRFTCSAPHPQPGQGNGPVPNDIFPLLTMYNSNTRDASFPRPLPSIQGTVHVGLSCASERGYSLLCNVGSFLPLPPVLSCRA